MTTIATNLQHEDAPTFILLTSVTLADIHFLFIAMVLIYIGGSTLLIKKSGKMLSTGVYILSKYLPRKLALLCSLNINLLHTQSCGRNGH
jgi:hypothetical protein